MLLGHSADVASSQLVSTNTSALASCTLRQGSESRWLFVRGLHHGGTTLAAAMLALHPDVSALRIGKYEDEVCR